MTKEGSCSQLNPKKIAYTMHRSQTRTGWAFSSAVRAILPWVHLSQNISPQFLQWCWKRRKHIRLNLKEVLPISSKGSKKNRDQLISEKRHALRTKALKSAAQDVHLVTASSGTWKKRRKKKKRKMNSQLILKHLNTSKQVNLCGPSQLQTHKSSQMLPI